MDRHDDKLTLFANMLYISYESYGGGTNNVTVAIDGATGCFATSTRGVRAAIKSLKQTIKRYYAKKPAQANHSQFLALTYPSADPRSR